MLCPHASPITPPPVTNVSLGSLSTSRRTAVRVVLLIMLVLVLSLVLLPASWVVRAATVPLSHAQMVSLADELTTVVLVVLVGT